MRKIAFYALFLITLSVGCTDKENARNYGGTETITLPKGQKLMMITWKEANLWYLTKPMKITDSVETYTFQEESEMGVWQGTVIVNETK